MNPGRISMICLISCFAVLSACKHPALNTNPEFSYPLGLMTPGTLPHNWLKKVVDLKTEESSHIQDINGYGTEQRPFGANNAGWEDLKKQRQQGDELWYWASPWIQNVNSSFHGYCIIRNGQIIKVFLSGGVSVI